jgi:hypothetical protein
LALALQTTLKLQEGNIPAGMQHPVRRACCRFSMPRITAKVFLSVGNCFLNQLLDAGYSPSGEQENNFISSKTFSSTVLAESQLNGV